MTELDSIHPLFCQNPETDFTRNRKITFSDTCRFLIEIQSKSLPNEVMDYFGHTISAPTASAYIQQRQKILTEGWAFLFHQFVGESVSFQNSLYHGYRLLACDGSDVNIYRNPSDHETFIKEGKKGYNMIHINALYDLLNHTYCDFIVQGKKKLHERKALNTMVDRYHSAPAIFIAFHSRKKEFIIQEIYARMILYNFCELATDHAVVTTKDNTKHSYKINFATAVNVCRAYLKSGGDENEMMLLIQRHLTPVRTDRKYPLNIHPKRNRDFVYRVA